MSETRTALLGGEVGGRGIFGGGRTKIEKRLMAMAMATAVIAWWLVGGLVGVVVGAAIYAGTYLFTYRVGGSRSAAAMSLAGLRWLSRSRRGLLHFVPPQATPQEAPSSRKAERARRATPDGVGQVRLLAAESPAGGEIAVLSHSNPGTPHYLTAALEVDGIASGLYEEADINAGAERFGRLLAACSGPTALADGVQLITRVVPVDPTEHELYVMKNHAVGAPDQLMRSYTELIGEARDLCEQQRNYIVARFPMSGEFAEAARDLGGKVGDDEIRCRVVYDEMNRLATLASNAGMRPIRLLGPHRYAALLRHLQDPDYLIDDVENIDFDTCWQESRTFRRYVMTNGKWSTRVARVTPGAVPTQPVHMRWTAPLLIGVQPAVIRTISVLMSIIPPEKARSEAKKDVSEDRGRVLEAAKAGRVTDMTEEARVTSSQQRLLDLQSGSGHAGVRWGMYLAISAPEGGIRRASKVIEDRAGDAGITALTWLDGAHDLTQQFAWPLWRGLSRAE